MEINLLDWAIDGEGPRLGEYSSSSKQQHEEAVGKQAPH